MDDRQILLLKLWKAEEAIRPKRQSVRVLRFRSRNGPLFRHPGISEEGQHYFRAARQDLEDLISEGLIRKRVTKRPGGEEWEIDLTDAGRTRAAALQSARATVDQLGNLDLVSELIAGRIASASTDETKLRWSNLDASLRDLNVEELQAFLNSVAQTTGITRSV